jgi:type I restriction enzyme S subunit
MKVCLPEIEEQQAIADYIDLKTSEIDSIINRKHEQLSILADYKKSIIYEYVTGKKEVPAV